MTRQYFLGTLVSVTLAIFALTAVSYGQNTPSAQNAAQAPAKSKVAVPVTMTECEGTNNCATWTFLGKQGNGQWPSGDVANLSVESLDGDSVVIRRADSTGSSAGLTAVYTGTRHGDRVGGEFTSSWPGHWDDKAGNWYATIEKDAQSLPKVMHFCAQHCGTYIWDKGHYVSGGSILTVESFTRESVVIHRTDSGPYPLTAVLTGQISAKGNSVVNGTINFNSGASIAPFKLTWGTALNSIPGNAGPAQPQQQVIVVRPGPVCFPWFFSMICE